MSNLDPRILVANDSTRARRAIIDILRAEYPMAVFGEATRGSETITMTLVAEWDIAIVDAWMPDIKDVDVLRVIKAVKPALPVILTTMFTSPQSAMLAAKAGASAYIAQDAAPEELLAALRAALPRDTRTRLDAAS